MVGVYIVQPNKSFLLIKQMGSKTQPVFHGEVTSTPEGLLFLIHFKFLCGLVESLVWDNRIEKSSKDGI